MKLPALWIVVAFAAGVCGLEPLAWGTASSGSPRRLGAIVLRRAPCCGAITPCRGVDVRSARMDARSADWRPASSAPRFPRTTSRGSSRRDAWTRASHCAGAGACARIPWPCPGDAAIEIDLEQVEVAGAYMPVQRRAARECHTALSTRRARRRICAREIVSKRLVKARPPRNFLDPGAFDEHGYLARQGVDLTGSLRSGELLQLIDRPRPTLLQRLARVRGTLLARLDDLFAGQPERAAVLRAMLLGDRSFVDSAGRHRISEDRRSITCSSWPDCTSARSWFSSSGFAADCGSRSASRAW